MKRTMILALAAGAIAAGLALEHARQYYVGRVSDHFDGVRFFNPAGPIGKGALDVPFNSVGLNLYRDGRDSVAPHNDHLDEIRKGFPIALLSLGAVRRMTIRAKAAPRRVMHLDLEPGSLLVMDYATQLHYTHAVPKTTEPVGERISLAFRVKPPQ